MTLPGLPQVRTDFEQLQPLADHLNRHADRTNQDLLVASRGAVDAIPHAGTLYRPPRPLPPTPPWKLAVVQATGPAAAADYTDNRYWVKFAYLLQGITDTDTTKAVPTVEDATQAVIFTATSLAEPTGTHLMVPGDLAWVVAMRGRSSTGRTIVQWLLTPCKGGSSSGTVPPGTVFAVDLSSPSDSSDGDATTACAITYNVTDKLGNLLLTGASPECPRGVGLRFAATKGTAYYDADDNPVLFWANEPESASLPECGVP